MRGRSIRFIFDHRKATQCLNYFALKQGGWIDKLKALKLIYFADRFHLRKYGRLITNDTYFAMEYGPVASSTENIAEGSKYVNVNQVGRVYSKQYLCVKKKNIIKSVRAVDYDVFSESDLDALNFAWGTFGHLSSFKLVNLTHSYPEWAKNKEMLRKAKRVEIPIELFLDDPVTDVEKCFKLSDEDKKCLVDYLYETCNI